MLKFFFSTRLGISSGPGALSGASLPIVHSSCCFVTLGLYGTGSGYGCVSVMSEVFASGSDECVGRRTSLNWLAFSSFVVAVPFIVGMWCCEEVEFMYFLIVHIDFSSAVSTNSFHVLYLAFLIFWLYSFLF